MSVLSPKRVILFVAATLLALPLFANHPSPRQGPRMAFDEASGVGVLFGGRAVDDGATGVIHGSKEMWLWTGANWVQQFPAVTPSARSEHAMVYDSTRDRVVLFGGRKESDVPRQRYSMLNDTWVWKDGAWEELAPAAAPPVRFLHGATYDRDRDRVIVFGGYTYSEDGKFTLVSRHDTWEFDGETWTRVNENGPEVAKPLLVWDAERHETLMLGVDITSFETLMYRWNSTNSTWQSITPETLPTCVNEGQVAYQAHNQRVIALGGVCTGAEVFEEAFEWDGTNWTKLTTTATTRYVGAAVAYDTKRSKLVRFGGRPPYQTTPDAVTITYKNTVFDGMTRTGAPLPRSLQIFKRDPVRDVIWMIGGLSEYSFGAAISYLDDFWRYRDGQWSLMSPDMGAPIGCATPAGAFDTTRNVLIITCGGGAPYEWDGSTWKSFSNLSKLPSERRFASVAYDENIKKLVLFGGYDTVGNYRQDTWTWDGTAWTEVKPKTKPEHRAQATMWYDPLAKKTIIYSGAGRKSIEDHAERYNDMWSFDGAEWTKLSVTPAPGIRFGPQATVDRTTGKVIIFGGLRATIDEEDRVTQFYDNDLWVWDGAASSWTEIPLDNAPPARQNGGLEYDASSGKFILFGGFAGNFYFSDLWQWDGTSWTFLPDSPASYRRRSARP